MGILLSLAALAIAAAGGLGVVLLLSSRPSDLNPARVLGTALIAGAGLVSLSSFLLGFLFQGFWLRAAVVAVCLIPLWFAWRQGKLVRLRLPIEPIPFPRLLLFAAPVIPICFLTWLSLYRDLAWDGLFNWESKARVAFLNGGALPLDYYTSGYPFFHNRYPPLLPLLEAWIYGFLGHIDQSMIKLIGPYFFVAAILLLISVVNRESKARWTALLVILPFLLVPGVVTGEGAATTGYADFPLSAIYLCAVIYCVEYWRTRSAESARLLGVSAMLLPFVKSDGLVLLLCVVVAAAPLILRDRSWKAGAWMVLPGLCTGLGWAAAMEILGVPRESDFARFTPAVLIHNWSRAKPVLFWTLEELANWNRWSLLWPFALAAVVLLIMRRKRSEWFPWAVLVLMPMLLFPCAYFFSAWNPWEPHVKSSLPRLLLQIAPSAALMIGVTFASLVDDWTPAPRPMTAANETPESIEVLLRDAAEILAPTGLTVEDLRRAHSSRVSGKAADGPATSPPGKRPTPAARKKARGR